MDTERAERRLLEVTALGAMFDLVQLSPASFADAVSLVTSGEPESSERMRAALSQLACLSCCGVLDLGDGQLAFELPAEYPDAAPAHCSISALYLSRAAANELDTQLQTAAAAALGRESLLELAEVAQERLAEAAASRATLHESLQECSQLQQQQQQQKQLRCVLLRLDHMRSRVTYTRRVCAWAAELGLTGRLVMWQQLILIVIEGHHDDVTEYLTRARTVCIDVDAAGRKCRERMMDVLQDSALSGGADNVTERAWPDFRQLEPASVQEVAQAISRTHAAFADAASLLALLGLRCGV